MGSKVKRGIYPVEQYWPHILPNIRSGRMILDGDPVRVGCMRLQLFMLKGMKCAFCGIEGKFFRKEVDTNMFKDKLVWHLNLYAEGPGNQKILMTKDHIIPACKGGKGTLDNLQPMCAKCNNEVKGGRIGGYERLLFLEAFIKFDRNKRYK